MLTPEEYVKYNSAKAASEFGRALTPEEFRAARKSKLSWIREELKGFSSLCDYGAGTGWLKDICAELGMEYTAVDEIAQKGSFARCRHVDLVVSICCLEHQTPQEVIDFLDTARLQGDHLLIVTNNPKCIFSHYVLWDDITHVRLYTAESIAALMRCKGFEITKQFYQDPVLRFRSRLDKLIYRTLVKSLGMMFLSNPYNYWCILAKAPLAGRAAAPPDPPVR